MPTPRNQRKPVLFTCGDAVAGHKHTIFANRRRQDVANQISNVRAIRMTAREHPCPSRSFALNASRKGPMAMLTPERLFRS